MNSSKVYICRDENENEIRSKSSKLTLNEAESRSKKIYRIILDAIVKYIKTCSSLNTKYLTKYIMGKYASDKREKMMYNKQKQLHNDSNSLFNIIILNDLTLLKQKLGNDKAANKERIKSTIDPTGANIIHTAYSLKYYEIGRWLVKNYPDVGCQSYGYDEKFGEELNLGCEEMPYSGQTILHIAIFNKNIDEVRWMLEFYKNQYQPGLDILLNTAVRGKFFDKDSDNYYGSYPINFAAVTNDAELFNLVLSYLPDTKLGTNSLFMRDRHGNNCLHICIIHRLKDMYSNIKTEAKRILREEIKCAYNKLEHPSEDNYVLLEPLPEWNVRQKYDISITRNTVMNESSRGFFSKVKKQLSKNLITLLHRYMPYYEHCSASRAKHKRNARKVINGNLDNGFYFGYSLLSETLICPPPGHGSQYMSEALFNNWLDHAVETKVEERFEWVLNEEFLSSLTLTAGILMCKLSQTNSLPRFPLQSIR